MERGIYNPESKALFEKHLKGKNVMTPYLFSYGVSGRYAYEVTEGVGMDRKPIFGLTVLRRVTGEHCHDLSRMFHSLEEVQKWVNEIRKIGVEG